MKRWSRSKRDYVENAKIDAFIEEVLRVCKKHKMSIGHEDGHGAFEIKNFNESNNSRLQHAHDVTDNGKG